MGFPHFFGPAFGSFWRSFVCLVGWFSINVSLFCIFSSTKSCPILAEQPPAVCLLGQLEKKFTHYVGAAAAVKLFLIGPTFGCLFVFLFPGFVFCCHLLLICWCVQLCFIDLIHMYVCSIVFLFASFSFLFVGLFVGFIWQVWATFYLRPQKLKTIAMNNCLHLTSGCKSFTSFFYIFFIWILFVFFSLEDLQIWNYWIAQRCRNI